MPIQETSSGTIVRILAFGSPANEGFARRLINSLYVGRSSPSHRAIRVPMFSENSSPATIYNLSSIAPTRSHSSINMQIFPRSPADLASPRLPITHQYRSTLASNEMSHTQPITFQPVRGDACFRFSPGRARALL